MIELLLVSLTILTEPEWQTYIHKELGGVVEYRLDDGTRVDILLPSRAIEIDWATNWAEGVGQSTYYSKKTNRPPLVILLAKTDNWKRYKDRVEFCGIECWVFDTRKSVWIYGR